MDVEKIVVIGGSGTIGRDVCRLGVALGHTNVSVCLNGRAPTDEPWTAGVEWNRGDATQPGWESALHGAFSVVIAAQIPIELVVDQADLASVQQVVALHQGDAVAASRATTVVTFRDVTQEEVYSDGAVIEQLAMALLRCALEEHRGVLSHDETVRLGDAMMIQN